MKKKTCAIIIMDGWGIAPANDANALKKANTPYLDQLETTHPHTSLEAHGLGVGLPDGNQGNSEVGHMNIGAGRVVYQMLVRIDLAVKNKSIFKNDALIGAIQHCKKNNSNLHLMGLVQDQGVHAVTRHCNALLSLCKNENFNNVYVHIFSDGRDTPPKSCSTYIIELEKGIEQAGVGKIGTIIGRYYAMDRDNRWDRVKIAYDALTSDQGLPFPDWKTALEHAYQNKETDEFIKPRIIDNCPPIRANDAIINFNFRLDRAREITHAFTDADFSEFDRKKIENLKYVAFTSYYDEGNFDVAFPPQYQTNILGQVLADNDKKQLRCAETEKYAHVTFFFNDSNETPFKNEDRILVNSPKVATYDLQPEMSANEVKEKLLEAISQDKYDVIIANFANGDMVGHTGVFDAVVKAAETVDKCVGEVTQAILNKGGVVMITADHGNGECMYLEDGSPMTAHTTNPVPFILCGLDGAKLRQDGKLSDIAPTILKVIDVEQPKEMTGKSMF